MAKVVIESLMDSVQINPQVPGVAPIVLRKKGDKHEFATEGETFYHAAGIKSAIMSGWVKVAGNVMDKPEVKEIKVDGKTIVSTQPTPEPILADAAPVDAAPPAEAKAEEKAKPAPANKANKNK